MTAPGPVTGASGHQLLRKLNAEFAVGLSARMDQIERAWSAVRSESDTGAFETVRLCVHRLTGAGATFGYPAISELASRVEAALKAIGALDAVSVDALGEADHRLALLKMECVASQRREVPDSAELLLPNLALDRDPRTLLLVEDDAALATRLAAQLESKGYRVTISASPLELCELNDRIRPGAILMDIILDAGYLAGPEAVARMRATCTEPPPVVFFSSRPDLEARVAAIRAGGAAYFTKPIDIEQLVGKLDVLTGRRPRRPYRVLVVDDDPELAELYARTLRIAGMQAKVCPDPMQAMEALSGLEPDLVLLDFHMPGCSGPELAQALRQSESHESLPILFLSTESDRGRQIHALVSGGDDFLTKPIEPSDLVLAVASRAERGRGIRGLLERDGLTRLLNHASLKRNLQIEIARARRTGRPLSFAMIDIDEFKQVNDLFGHATGDRVLITLASLLSDRLRITDVVGRLGGDEIAVVMPMTEAAAALGVLDPIRAQFSELEQLAERGVTFSCGIADSIAFPDPRALSEAADRALYEAKQAGRNRIARATPAT